MIAQAIKLVSIFIGLIFIISFIRMKESKDLSSIPIPTDIIQKKKDRKKFKMDRNAWMENMHRAAPETNWKSIDRNTRETKIDEITNFRKSLQRKGLLSQNDNSQETVSSFRDVPGQWIERGSNNLAGRIRTTDVDFDNDHIYCASSGGNIWRGNLDGSNWQSLNDYFQIKGIHFLKRIDYNGFNRLLMVNGKQCYRSNNDALIIDEAEGLSSIQDWGWIFRTVIDNSTPNTIYLGIIEWDYDLWTHLPAIYKSTDGGISFTKIIELTTANGFTIGSNNFDLWSSPMNGGGLYVLNDGKCYKLDTGDVLTFIGEFTPTESGNNILIGGVTGTQTFLHSRVGGQLYSSLDGGYNWTAKGDLPSGTFTINSFECSPNEPNNLVIGTLDGYTSNNGGDTWTIINYWYEYYNSPETKLHADLPEFSFYTDPSTGEEFQLISTDGGLYISYDQFETVQNISLSGLGVSQYYSTYTARNDLHHIYAGSQDQGFQRHITDGDYGDDALDFEQVISGDYGHIISGNGGTSLWTDYPGFAMYYPDVANSNSMSTWDFQGSGYLWLPPLMIDPFQANVAYVGGGGINTTNNMVKMTYSNSQIVAEDMNFSFDAKISAMAWSPISYYKWYVSTEDGQFYYSNNAGQSFSQTSSFTGPGSHYFYGSTILPSPINNQRIYIGGSGYSNPAVYLSTDGGETFSAFDNGLPNTLVYELVSLPDESMIFAATEVGPYYYSTENGEWADLAGNDAPDQTYWTVDYIPEINTVRFGTYGRGIWDYTFDYNPVILQGDINQDNIVNIVDLFLMVNHVMQNETSSDFHLNVADFNSDNEIDIIDILYLSELLNG